MMSLEDQFTQFASTASARVDLRARSVRGAMFTAAGGGVDFALRLASTLILARLLIPEHFGLIGMVTAVTGVAEQFSTMGLSTATIQAREITHRQCSNLFWINVAGGCCFGMLIYALAPVLSTFFQDARLGAITLAISTNFLWGGLTVQHEALLLRQMRQPQVAGNRLVAGFLSTCVAITLALSGQGYWALVWREVTRSFLIAVGVWRLCPWLPGLPSRGTNIRTLLCFGRDITLAEVFVCTISRLDSLLVGRFFGPSALGLYRQACNLMAPVEQVTAPMYNVSQPALSMLQAEPERYRLYYQRILLVVSLATIPFGAFSAIYAEEIVSVAFGPKWMGAAVFLRIFGMAAIVRPAVGTCGIVLVTCGRSGKFLVITLVHGMTLIMLMAMGIPWGAEGIAVAHVSTSVLLMLPKLHYSFADTPVTMGDFFRPVSRPFLASAMMALMLVVLRNAAPLGGGLVGLLAGCVIATATYFAFLATFPGGWLQLRSLSQEVLEGVRPRSRRVPNYAPQRRS